MGKKDDRPQLTIRLDWSLYEKLRALAYRRNLPSPSAMGLRLIEEAVQADAEGIAAVLALRETAPTVRVDEPAADDSAAQKKKPAADDRQLTLTLFD